MLCLRFLNEVYDSMSQAKPPWVDSACADCWEQKATKKKTHEHYFHGIVRGFSGDFAHVFLRKSIRAN